MDRKESEDVNLTISDEGKKYLADQLEKNATLEKALIHFSAQSMNRIPEYYDAESILT
jgi:hypothetical protein